MIGKEIRRLGTTALTPKNHDTIIILSSSLKCKSVWLSLWVCICSFLWGVNVSMYGSLLLCSHPAWELQLFLDLTRAPPPAQVFAQKRISFPCLSFTGPCVCAVETDLIYKQESEREGARCKRCAQNVLERYHSQWKQNTSRSLGWVFNVLNVLNVLNDPMFQCSECTASKVFFCESRFPILIAQWSNIELRFNIQWRIVFWKKTILNFSKLCLNISPFMGE